MAHDGYVLAHITQALRRMNFSACAPFAMPAVLVRLWTAEQRIGDLHIFQLFVVQASNPSNLLLSLPLPGGFGRRFREAFTLLGREARKPLARPRSETPECVFLRPRACPAANLAISRHIADAPGFFAMMFVARRQITLDKRTGTGWVAKICHATRSHICIRHISLNMGNMRSRGPLSLLE